MFSLNKKAQSILDNPKRMERLKGKYPDWRMQMIGCHDNPARIAFYLEMRERGVHKNMAGILASQKPPGLQGTDSQFLEGTGTQSFMDDWTPETRAHYKAKADAAGVSIAGKVYKSSLAAEPGDPRAWVSDSHDVKKLCEERNLDCDGMVKHKAAPSPEADKPKVRLADDIVDRLSTQYRMMGEGPADDRELREMVIDKHGSKA